VLERNMITDTTQALYTKTTTQKREQQKRRTKIEASPVVVSLKELALLCVCVGQRKRVVWP
jgi:hypothetical protein